MLLHNKIQKSYTRKRVMKGSGFLNKLIDKLPVELHILGYRNCGPGTKLEKRIARGDKPINQLDSFCRTHDLKYQQSGNSKYRSEADQLLGNQALKRFKSSDASVEEKIGLAAVMKAKRKLGMGMNNRIKKGKGLRRKRKNKSQKRMIPTPNLGGFLPLLLPILGALGALGGGAAGIAKAVNDAKANEKQLAELKRHNLVLEANKKGKGLYLAPYKKNLK